MSKLEWGTAGSRIYETGVDRGVLYLQNQPGVAWGGLVAVKEGVVGGESESYYVDGFKYANVVTSEDYTATIEAYSAPPEFAVCDGTKSLSNGLFVTQQPRESFDFSYRSLIANEIDGTDHGYKLHLVYGALVQPSSVDYGTLNENPEAPVRSWSITTLPPMAHGFRPTAHFVFDSRRTPAKLLKYIEQVLYGTVDTVPKLPTQSELLHMIDTAGPVVRHNLSQNPQAITYATAGGSSWNYNAGSGGSGTASPVVASDGPVLSWGNIASYIVSTQTVTGLGGERGPHHRVSVVGASGDSVRAGFYIRANRVIPGRYRFSLYRDGSEIFTQTQEIELGMNVWQRFDMDVIATQPYDQVRVGFEPTVVGGIAPKAGDSYACTGGFVSIDMDDFDEYFDGYKPNNALESYGWDGLPGRSPSWARAWGEA